jgi:hypothetical protein
LAHKEQLPARRRAEAQSLDKDQPLVAGLLTRQPPSELSLLFGSECAAVGLGEAQLLQPGLGPNGGVGAEDTTGSEIQLPMRCVGCAESSVTEAGRSAVTQAPSCRYMQTLRDPLEYLSRATRQSVLDAAGKPRGALWLRRDGFLQAVGGLDLTYANYLAIRDAPTTLLVLVLEQGQLQEEPFPGKSRTCEVVSGGGGVLTYDTYVALRTPKLPLLVVEQGYQLDEDSEKAGYLGEDSEKAGYLGEDSEKAGYLGEDSEKAGYLDEDSEKAGYSGGDSAPGGRAYGKGAAGAAVSTPYTGPPTVPLMEKREKAAKKLLEKLAQATVKRDIKLCNLGLTRAVAIPEVFGAGRVRLKIAEVVSGKLLIYPTSFNPLHYYNPYRDQRAWWLKTRLCASLDQLRPGWSAQASPSGASITKSYARWREFSQVSYHQRHRGVAWAFPEELPAWRLPGEGGPESLRAAYAREHCYHECRRDFMRICQQ